MEARQVVSRGFFVACRDASELFDKLEETFYQIALSVEGEIAMAFGFAICLGRNNGRYLAHFETLDEAV